MPAGQPAARRSVGRRAENTAPGVGVVVVVYKRKVAALSAVILPCSHDGERHAPVFFWSRLREFPLKSCANHRPVYPSTARVLGSSLVRSAAAVLLYERPRGENLLEQPNERTAHSAWNFFFLLPRLTCSMDDGP